MIIKRQKVFSKDPRVMQAELDKYKSHQITGAERGISAGTLGFMGAIPGLLAKNRIAAGLGAAAGIGAGLYLTSNRFKKNYIDKKQKEINSLPANKSVQVIQPQKDNTEYIQELKELGISNLYFKVYKITLDKHLKELESICGGDGDEYPGIFIKDPSDVIFDFEDTETGKVDHVIYTSLQYGPSFGYDFNKKTWIDSYTGRSIPESRIKPIIIKFYESELSDWKKNQYWDDDSDLVIKYITELIKIIKIKI